MKETYSHPTVTNADLSEATPLAPWGVVAAAAATMAGYKAGRSVAKSARAMPTVQLPSLSRDKS